MPNTEANAFVTEAALEDETAAAAPLASAASAAAGGAPARASALIRSTAGFPIAAARLTTAAGKPGTAAPAGSAASFGEEEGDEEPSETFSCALRAQPRAADVCRRYRGGSPSSAPADPGIRCDGSDESTSVSAASTPSESAAARPKARSSGTLSYWQSTRTVLFSSTERTAQTRSAGAGRRGGEEEEEAPGAWREKRVLPPRDRPGRTRAPSRETMDGLSAAAAATADRRSAQDSGVVATSCFLF